MRIRFFLWTAVGLLTVFLSSIALLSQPVETMKPPLILEEATTILSVLERSNALDIKFEVLNANTYSTVTLQCLDNDKIGFTDRAGNLQIPQCFTSTRPFSEGIALVGFEDTFGEAGRGFINQEAQFVFPPFKPEQLVEIKSARLSTDRDDSFFENRFPLRREPNGKIGFIDQTGTFVIEPQFDHVGGFYEGLSLVCQDFDSSERGRGTKICGYIDLTGNFAVPLQFAFGTSFHRGIALVGEPGQEPLTYKVISRNMLQPLVDDIFDYVGRYGGLTFCGGGSLSEDSWFTDSGLLRVRIPEARYPIDRASSASMITDENAPEDYCNPGLGTWGYLDVEKGGYAIEPHYREAERFIDGHAFVVIYKNDDRPGIPEQWRGRRAVIDMAGNVIAGYGEEAFYKHLRGFQEGLLALNDEPEPGQSYKWGYIDRSGRWAIPPQFSKARNFQEGLAVVGIPGTEGAPRSGVIDRKGNYVTSQGFTAIGDFYGGRAWVRDPETRDYGFIDSEGNYVVPPRFNRAQDFAQGLAAVKDETSELWGYINQQGELVIDFQFSEAELFSSEGYAVVTGGHEGDKVGLIDRQGNYVLRPIYERIEPFKDGFAIAYLARDEQANAPIQIMISSEGDVFPYSIVTLPDDGLVAVRERLSASFHP